LVVPVVEVRPVITPGLMVPIDEVRPELAPRLVVPVVEVRPELAPRLVVPAVEVRLAIASGMVVPGVGPVDLTGVTRVRMERLSYRRAPTTTRRLPVVLTTVPAVLNFLRRNLPASVRLLVTLPCERFGSGRRRVPLLLLRPEARRFVATMIPTLDSIALRLRVRPLVATVSRLIPFVVRRVP
jgi:hypothetical protein